jgi:hypothetical protein
MAKHFLEDFIKKLDPNAQKGSHKDVMEIWYNRYGDCIEFQATQEAVVTDRIDDYLTIYKSAESDEPVGFKMKDVNALIKKYGYDTIAVQAAVAGKKLVSVTALLLSAFGDLTPSINRRQGYTAALNVAPKNNEVLIPC